MLPMAPCPLCFNSDADAFGWWRVLAPTLSSRCFFSPSRLTIPSSSASFPLLPPSLLSDKCTHGRRDALCYPMETSLLLPGINAPPYQKLLSRLPPFSAFLLRTEIRTGNYFFPPYGGSHHFSPAAATPPSPSFMDRGKYTSSLSK